MRVRHSIIYRFGVLRAPSSLKTANKQWFAPLLGLTCPWDLDSIKLLTTAQKWLLSTSFQLPLCWYQWDVRCLSLKATRLEMTSTKPPILGTSLRVESTSKFSALEMCEDQSPIFALEKLLSEMWRTRWTWAASSTSPASTGKFKMRLKVICIRIFAWSISFNFSVPCTFSHHGVTHLLFLVASVALFVLSWLSRNGCT